MHLSTKCTFQETMSPVTNLVRLRCAEGFNSGVIGLSLWFVCNTRSYARALVHMNCSLYSAS
jgi:hypothetical protein